jgi:VanZ family protein
MAMTTNPELDNNVGQAQAWRLFRAWLPAMIGVLCIMMESTETFSAAHTSGPLHRLWEAIFGVQSDQDWSEIHHIIRKTGHFLGYGTLSLLFHRAWRLTAVILHQSRQRIENIAYALGCTLVVASGDEFHQTFVPGRTGLVRDVLLDMVGACTLQLLFWLFVLATRPFRTAPPTTAAENA